MANYPQKLKPLVRLIKKLRKARDPAHDFAHVKRVMRLASVIADKSFDKEKLLLLCLLHGLTHEEEKSVKGILEQMYGKDAASDIIKSAKRLTKNPETYEEKVVHDANLLDSLGAVGMARAFMKGGYEKQSIKKTIEIIKRNTKRKFLTKRGRTLGRRRKEFTSKFLKRLEKELLSDF